MIQCDVQEPDCKIWYHVLLNMLVLVSPMHGKEMDHDLDFICPVCSDTAVSVKIVEITTNSRTSLSNSPDMAIPSAIPVTASNYNASVDLPSFSVIPPPAFLHS